MGLLGRSKYTVLHAQAPYLVGRQNVQISIDELFCALWFYRVYRPYTPNMGGLGPLDTVNWDPLGGPNRWYTSPSLPDGYTLGCPRMGHPIDEYGVFGDMVYRPDRGRTLLRDIPRSSRSLDLRICSDPLDLWISGSERSWGYGS